MQNRKIQQRRKLNLKCNDIQLCSIGLQCFLILYVLVCLVTSSTNYTKQNSLKKNNGWTKFRVILITDLQRNGTYKYLAVVLCLEEFCELSCSHHKKNPQTFFGTLVTNYFCPWEVHVSKIPRTFFGHHQVHGLCLQKWVEITLSFNNFQLIFISK